MLYTRLTLTEEEIILDLLKQVNTLRGSMTLEELQELVIKKLANKKLTMSLRIIRLKK